MSQRRSIRPKLLVCDFDGVLTDNSVLVGEDGKEYVACSRADGLAFDMLKRASIPTLILSTEKNRVVSARARKLRVPTLQGVSNKALALKNYCAKHRVALRHVMYLGNDLNDLEAMKLVGYTACPSDSHKSIKRFADTTLKSTGGSGVVREVVEKLLGLRYGA